MSALEKFLRLVMPQSCVCCGMSISGKETLCKSCLQGVKNTVGEWEYSLKSYGVNDKFKCKVCGVYSGVLARNLQRFKFSGKSNYAKGFAVMMDEALAGGKSEFDIICFVPITKEKKRKRGYNQSELLAKRLSELKGIPMESLLAKPLETSPQHELSREARKINLRGKFTVTRECAGKRILLVDDILTTGSTMCECAGMLMKNAAAEVYGITVAGTHKKREKGDLADA